MRKRERGFEPQPDNGGASTKPLSVSALRKAGFNRSKAPHQKKRKRNHYKSRFSATMANWWGDMRDL